MAWPFLREGRWEELGHIAMVSHHLVTFAREVADGTAEKCFYNPGASPSPVRAAGLPQV